MDLSGVSNITSKVPTDAEGWIHKASSRFYTNCKRSARGVNIKREQQLLNKESRDAGFDLKAKLLEFSWVLRYVCIHLSVSRVEGLLVVKKRKWNTDPFV